MKKLFALIALVGLGGFIAGCGDSAAEKGGTQTPSMPNATPGSPGGPPGGMPVGTPPKVDDKGNKIDDDKKDGAGAKDDSKDEAAPEEKKDE